jgi:GNAT superfamily N-acetyltransferase
VTVTPQIVKTKLKHIQSLRALFLQASNFQIRYDACHARGWSDSYLLKMDDVAVGYGSIKAGRHTQRDTIFEFYVVPPFRKWSTLLFGELIAAAGVTQVECQSNDLLLSSMLHEFARDITADVVLFEDAVVTEYRIGDAAVRRRRAGDRIFDHAVEPVGDHVLEVAGEIVATGGFMLHYNMPFADLYMEVRTDRRRQGFGRFILQEVKKACYLAGRVPGARCQLQNTGSRAALIKAGMRTCGYMLTGTIKPEGRTLITTS